MIRFLAALFQIILEAWRAWRENELRDQGRKSVEDQLDENVRLAESAADPAVDPARAERLRERFDRSATDTEPHR